MSLQDKQTIAGQLRDLVGQTTPYEQPFLYYLPEYLYKKEFESISPVNLLRYAQIALTLEKKVVLSDGLRILNQLVVPGDGSIKPTSPSYFFNNNTFSWRELGGHTTIADVVSHIVNKTIFIYSLGESIP
jgi:hypothetical protein